MDPTPTEKAEEQRTLAAIWRKMLERQKKLTPEERAEQERQRREKARKEQEAYHAQLREALDRECAGQSAVDLRLRLQDAGVERQHLEGLKVGLAERPAWQAARRWWSQSKVATGEVDLAVGPDGHHIEQPRLVRRFPFLVLAGDSGCGKTQAAAWCLREAARAYPWGRGATGTNLRRPFVMWHGTAMAATALYGNHSATLMDEAEQQWLEAERATLLVLDDLFPQRKPLSGPHHDRLTRLLTARHGAHRSTVITVNANTGSFANLLDGQSIGGPLWRRVSEGGIIVTLQPKGDPHVLRGGVAVEWKKEKR